MPLYSTPALALPGFGFWVNVAKGRESNYGARFDRFLHTAPPVPIMVDLRPTAAVHGDHPFATPDGTLSGWLRRDGFTLREVLA